MNKQTQVKSGKSVRLNKLLKVRYKNIKMRYGRLIGYIILLAIYVFLDVIAAVIIGIDNKPGDSTGLIGFIFSILKAADICVLGVFLSSVLFGTDRTNNQMSIELRSGYDRTDLFASRVIEILVSFMILFVAMLLINGISYGMLKTPSSYGSMVNDGRMNPSSVVPTSYKLNLDATFFISDLWYGVIGFLIATVATIGFSYVMNTGGATTLGIIISLVLTIVIIMASVGTFTHGVGFMGQIPGWGKILGDH